MARALALFCHLAVLLAALLCSHSTSGFLLNGPVLVLLLDRYVLRLLPWRAPVNWPRELAIRGGCFLVGTLLFYCLRPGIVPWWEAAYRGALVSATVFACGCLHRLHRAGPAGGLTLWAVLLSLLGFLIPPGVALHPLHTVPKRTPAALGLAFEYVRLGTADGLTLAGWLVPHPNARGNLLFCHGHGRNRGHVAGLLPTLHGLRLNVLAVDFRGHGESAGHTSTFGRREVRDVLAAAKYLRERYPDKPLLLAGVSLGAAVCLEALPCLPDARGLWSEGAFARLSVPVEHTFRVLPAWLRTPLVGAYRWLGWLDCGLWLPAANPVDAADRVRDIPVCFCHGCRDELVPFTEAAALYASYPGPKSCWWVENASHYNVRQRNQQEYLRRLGTFLNKCLRGAVHRRCE